jgi:hypothetical protein
LESRAEHEQQLMGKCSKLLEQSTKSPADGLEKLGDAQEAAMVVNAGMLQDNSVRAEP